MAITAAEQYLLELINRGRLDPAAEAARFGISLNAGLDSGTISTSAKQVLAHNTKLETAATGHSNWMLSVDKFQHTGSGGSQPWDRAVAAGYTGYSKVGENIALFTSTGAINLNDAVSLHYKGLFESALHRENTMDSTYREIGIAQVQGNFTSSGDVFNASMLTENFGKKGTAVFLTGVAYTDSNDNNFYTIGEARSGVTFTSQSKTATTASAGGYGLSLATDSTQDVTGTVGAKAFSVQLNMASGNVKLDVVDANTFFTSGDITLKTGIHNARLLGVAGLDATGNASANTLWGNKGANILTGNDGNDVLYGGAGNDSVFGYNDDDLIYGSTGSDRLYGGADTDSIYGGDQGDLVYGGTHDDFIYGGTGNDSLYGGSENDYLSGGDGTDRLYGGSFNDTLSGGAGRDSYYFYNDLGEDTVTGFSVSGGERLKLDDAIWDNLPKTTAQIVSEYASVSGGTVIFNFGANEVITLNGLTSTAGLAALIDIF